MSASVQSPEWIALIRNLALGTSIAACIVVPSARAASAASQVEVTAPSPHVIYAEYAVSSRKSEAGILYAPIFSLLPNDAPLNLLPDVGAEPLVIAVKASVGEGTLLQEEVQADDLPEMLQDISGLPVSMLANLVGVSRTTYHKWFRGTGVSAEHAARLADLHDTLRILREVQGDQLHRFLITPGSAGTPLSLLQAGDDGAVIGLALRSNVSVSVQPRASDTVWQSPDVRKWLHPVLPLDWEHGPSDDRAGAQVLSRLGPALVLEDSNLIADDADAPAYRAYGFIVE